MPKQKQRTNTVWDQAVRTWRFKANIRPFSSTIPIEILDIKGTNNQPINIKNSIDKVIANLLSKDAFKQASSDKDAISTITLTEGRHPGDFGYWTGQITALLSGVAGVANNVLNYLRLHHSAPIAPFNSTEEQYKEYTEKLTEYNNQLEEYALHAFWTGTVTTVFICLLYIVNQYRVQRDNRLKEQSKLIENLVNRLTEVKEEIDIKENAIEKIAKFLSKDHSKFLLMMSLQLLNKIHLTLMVGCFGNIPKLLPVILSPLEIVFILF